MKVCEYSTLVRAVNPFVPLTVESVIWTRAWDTHVSLEFSLRLPPNKPLLALCP